MLDSTATKAASYTTSWDTIASQGGVLETHWFLTLADAAGKMEDWRKYYNEVRPHGSIGHKLLTSSLNLCWRHPPAIVQRPGHHSGRRRMGQEARGEQSPVMNEG